MDFSRYQEAASRSTGRLRMAYTVAVAAVVLIFNLAAGGCWWLLFGDAPLPFGFVAINTLATGGLIVGGTLVEMNRLGHDIGQLAARLGARQLDPGAGTLAPLERRAINVLEEMALAARQPIPRLFVLENNPSINALATGLSREDAAVMVTRGAIERLDRSELQGVIAHEIAHLASGDVVVHTRLAAMNYGLELVANAGRRALGDLAAGSFWRPFFRNAAQRDFNPILFVPGLLLLTIGSIGHLAALLLTAAIGRTREYHADALAVRLTRLPQGLGQALRKVAWQARHPAQAGRVPPGLHGLEHAMFHQPGLSADAWWSSAWFDTHPPLIDRIERLLGPQTDADRIELEACRSEADDPSPTRDLYRSAKWLAHTALPPLAFSAGAVETGSPDDRPIALVATLDTHTGHAVRPYRVPGENRPDLLTLVAATRDANEAAALSAMLVVGIDLEPGIWSDRWRSAQGRQPKLAAALRALGPQLLQGLRWSLLEMCAATLKPLPPHWREDLLRMLRGQVELDQRVTLTEWIYYMLLRVRMLPANEAAWRGDEGIANTAEAVRWVTTLLTEVVGEPVLRGERLATSLIREFGLSRTGQTYPPMDVGGLQAAVASLRRLPMLQRPLLMRQLVDFLPAEAPVEARDFLRVLALIIDSPMPVFKPVLTGAPDPAPLSEVVTEAGIEAGTKVVTEAAIEPAARGLGATAPSSESVN